MDWCKGITFYEELAKYHLRYAKHLAEKFGFNFTYDVSLLGLYKDKKQISNTSRYKGNFDQQFYDCILKKYSIYQNQIEELIYKLRTSDFNKDITSDILDRFNYTNYDVQEYECNYVDNNRLNNKYRTFKNHIKDKVVINDVNYVDFTFPKPSSHIKEKKFNIRVNIEGLGYECFKLYYKDNTLPERTLCLDRMIIKIPYTDHVINRKALLISFDQRVIINLNEIKN